MIILYNNYLSQFKEYLPGIFVATIIALAAKFISYNYQVPAMFMALLIGMALHFLAEEGKCVRGLSFASQYILRLGIILLGTRISFDLILSLDPYVIFIITISVFLTILFGIFILKSFGFDWKFGILLGSSVAICGASAAMAIAAVLPRDKKSDQNLTLLFLVLPC